MSSIWSKTGVTAAAVTVVSALAAQAFSGALYSSAVDEHRHLAAEVVKVQHELDTSEDAASASRVRDHAQTVIELLQSMEELTPEAKAALQGLTDATDALSEALAAVEAIGRVQVPELVETPSAPFWSLFGMAGEIQDSAVLLQAQEDSWGTVADDLPGLVESAQEAGGTVLTQAASHAAVLEQTYPDAGIEATKALRAAGERLAGQRGLSAQTVQYVGLFADAVTALRDEHEAQQFSESDPWGANKAAIRAYARELAGDMLIEVNFSNIVNERGEFNGKFGGLATWSVSAPGEGTVLLSESTAKAWGGADDAVVRALIAHEVGHIAGSACLDMFDPAKAQSVEAFATAWAISRGHTVDGNGASLYGEPSPGYVEAVRRCSP